MINGFMDLFQFDSEKEINGKKEREGKRIEIQFKRKGKGEKPNKRQIMKKELREKRGDRFLLLLFKLKIFKKVKEG